MSSPTPGSSTLLKLESQNPDVADALHALRQHAQQYQLSTQEAVRGKITGRPVVPLDGVFGVDDIDACEQDYAVEPLADYMEETPCAPPPDRSVRLSRRIIDPGSPSVTLSTSRQRGWPVLVASLLLLSGIVALAVTLGPAVYNFLLSHWRSIIIPIGGISVGIGIVLLVNPIGDAPLRDIIPPEKDTEKPLEELKELAERTVNRLRSAYRLQLWTVIIVSCLFVALIIWTVVMVSQERILYASAFGSGSLAMAILSQWKWQPFDRVNQARQSADNADTLSTGLRLRMKTISEINDPTLREQAQWKAVEEYLAAHNK